MPSNITTENEIFLYLSESADNQQQSSGFSFINISTGYDRIFFLFLKHLQKTKPVRSTMCANGWLGHVFIGASFCSAKSVTIVKCGLGSVMYRHFF